PLRNVLQLISRDWQLQDSCLKQAFMLIDHSECSCAFRAQLLESSYLSSGQASDQHALATRVQHSVFAGMVEFMGATGETRTQKHDEGNVETDADFNFMGKLVCRRFLMPQLLSKIEPFICCIAGEIRILVVDALGMSGGDPELRRSCGVQGLYSR